MKKKEEIFLLIIVLSIVLFSIFSTFYTVKKTNNYLKLISSRSTQDTTQVSICFDVPLPVISSKEVFNISSGELFEYTVNATSPNNKTIYYYDNTTMFEINISTGLISFIPSSNDAGLNIIKITAAHEICPGTGSEMLLFLFIDWVVVPPVPPLPDRITGPGVPCEENWVCGSWSECKNISSLSEFKANLTRLLWAEYNIPIEKCGLQERLCIDRNSCRTTDYKPIERRICLLPELPLIPPIIPPLKPVIKCPDGTCEFNEIFTCFEDCWIFWGISILIIIWIIYICRKHITKTHKKQIHKKVKRQYLKLLI
ncbi:MAG: hypothetical protein KAT66_11010 [Candidatus Lokiarchaeota archaeon]|nr:hypothetical protein [Candidatus Lokiarchaeota archaeon]